MPRRPSIVYFASRQAYYCQIDKRQHRLASGPDDAPRGPTYLAALERFRRLLEGQQVGSAGNQNTVRVICEEYLYHTRSQVRASTQTRRVSLLKPFVAALGDVRVSDLSPLRISAFVEQMRVPRLQQRGAAKPGLMSWGDSSITSFFETASAAFQWAIRGKLITENPLQGIKRPGSRSRSRDCLISPEQHQRLLQLCRSAGMRRIVIALENTGARPGEIQAAEARYWDADRNALVYAADVRRREGEFRPKSAAYKDRIIYFTGAAREQMQRLVGQYPTGPLFRKQDGHPYSAKAIQAFFKFKRQAVGMPALTAYSYRHTFATRWLLEGRSIDVLAELLGNTPQVIRKHYAHLCNDWPAIRRQLEDFMRSPLSENNPPNPSAAQTTEAASDLPARPL